MEPISEVLSIAGLRHDAASACQKLGICSAGDVERLDVARDMQYLEQQGLTYVDIIKMKEATETLGRHPVKTTTLAKATGKMHSRDWVEPNTLSPARSPKHIENASFLAGISATTSHKVAKSKAQRPVQKIHPQLYFADEHIALSPISMHPIKLRGVVWPTALHYVEGVRHDRTIYAELIRKIHDPADMLAASKKIRHFARGTEKEDMELWREVFAAKYSQHDSARTGLVDTGDLELVYSAPDAVWGAGLHGDGGNVIGKLLTEVRTNILYGSLPRSSSPTPHIDIPTCSVCEKYPQSANSTWCTYCRAHVQRGSDENAAALAPRAMRAEYPLSRGACRICQRVNANAGFSWCQTCFVKERARLYGKTEHVQARRC